MIVFSKVLSLLTLQTKKITMILRRVKILKGFSKKCTTSKWNALYYSKCNFGFLVDHTYPHQKWRLDVVWKLHIMAFNKIFYGKHSKQQRHTFTTRHKSKHYQDEIKERQKSQAKFETRCDQLIMQREYR